MGEGRLMAPGKRYVAEDGVAGFAGGRLKAGTRVSLGFG